MAMSTARRHEAIFTHIAELLEVCAKGAQVDPEAPLPPALIEPAVLLLLSTYPDCPGGSDIRSEMMERPRVDVRTAEKLAARWTGWCKLLHTAVPMGAITINEQATTRLRSPALAELISRIGPPSRSSMSR